MLQAIIGDISGLALVLQVENIVEPKELMVPSYMLNKPHRHNEERYR